MDIAPETKRAIEAIVLVTDTPVEPSLLAQLLEVPKADIERACEELAAEYEADGRGFVLARVAGGYRYQTHPDMAPYIERYVLEGQSARLSAAALETLAIVAYKQPVSRMQIAAIRGVNVDGVMRTLQQRGYIDDVGRDPGPGNAVLFGTTPLFLERLGLDNLDELPPLTAFVPGADVVEALEETLRPEPNDGADASPDNPADPASPDTPAGPVDDAAATDAGADDPNETEGNANDDGADWMTAPTEVVGTRMSPAPTRPSDDDITLDDITLDDSANDQSANENGIDVAPPVGDLAEDAAPAPEPVGVVDDDETDETAASSDPARDGLVLVDLTEPDHGADPANDAGTIEAAEVIDLDAARPNLDRGDLDRHPASGNWSTPGVASVRPMRPSTGVDAPLAKNQPIIEIVRPLASPPPDVEPLDEAPPPPAPFRATPGHQGAGATSTETAVETANEQDSDRGAPNSSTPPSDG